MLRWLLFFLVGTSLTVRAQSRFYVAPSGKDSNPGTVSLPLATLAKALEKVKTAPQPAVQIFLRKGTYYLTETIRIDPELVQNKTLTISNFPNETVQISGGRRLSLRWQKTGQARWTAPVEGPVFEQLFLNGKKQILARYPNFDARARVFNGTAADALSEARINGWQSPEGGYVHALHEGEWGDFHYRITGKSDGKLQLEGGWQNNRPSPLHAKERFVENIFEEMDAPGEWFYDRKTQQLHLIPPTGVNPTTAIVEVSQLKGLIALNGTPDKPLRQVTLRGIRFVQTERTFMEPYEPLLRSDWMMYRGAAVFLENTENCQIEDCQFSNLGGNALIFSRYNRKSAVEGSHFFEIGASAISFIGDSSAVRSPAFRYEQFVPYDQMDLKPGPKNNHYPLECVAENNLIHDIGRIEKQSAGVQIAMASGIVVRHNSIYQVPRAGINIGDGTWGGHLLEFNDVFDTVLETGDHGAFNSWGRDRYWHPNRSKMDSLVAAHPELILIDAQKTTIIRNNRFRCDHGWDIDLDDGSSNYLIYNNVLLNGGLKFREGFNRTAQNNILINNSFHPHVWFKNSGDVFRNNIVMRSYFPIGVQDWGKEVDYNLFPDEGALLKAQKDGTDFHSTFGDPVFVQPEKGNYQVRASSPALKIGFQNFPMNQFGVQKTALRALARTPKLPVLLDQQFEKSVQELTWLGALLRNVRGLGDRSAYGLPDENGIIVVNIPAGSLLENSGLKTGDVIRTANQEETPNIGRLVAIQQQVTWTGRMNVSVIRNQQVVKLSLPLK
ncbi:right-handed parallel beta-helix repeat-containing protein [Larkinella terrae]|uniref:Peptide-binding protein n=1 Tax=Larkinella terrae TaxID=2025311 RepID=A0A7K0EJB8_9BACT|nr:right-handed parallel beta-helix repeat-containing protein [Larkinella terrae]MRS61943.1 peptide-binding protein [Larkinella terrae]